MTKEDEIVMVVLLDAARAAGYDTRRPAHGFIGVIALLKVCKLLEEIHFRFVKELEKYIPNEKQENVNG